MTYELRLQRLLDAPPEVVFDTFVDPEVTEELFTPPGGSGWSNPPSISASVGRGRSRRKGPTASGIAWSTCSRRSRAWTDPDVVMQWWGPEGFTAPAAKMDVRVGATSLVAMRSPAGQDMYNTWTYEAVEPQERLVFITRFAEQDGNVVDPTTLELPPDLPSGVRTEDGAIDRTDPQRLPADVAA